MEFNFERRLAYNFMMFWFWAIAAVSGIVLWVVLSKFFGNFIEGFFGSAWGWIAFFVALFGIPISLILAFFMTVSEEEAHETKQKSGSREGV